MKPVQVSTKRKGTPPLLLCFFIACAALTTYLVWLVFFDDLTPDDSAMIPRWSYHAGATNPLQDFRLVEKSTPFKGIGGDTSLADPRSIAGIETANVPFSKAFRALLESEPSSWRTPKPVIASVWDPLSDYSKSLFFMADSQLRYCRSLNHSGDWQEAIRQALYLWKLSHGLAKAEGGLEHLIQALEIQDVATTALAEAVTASATPPPLLQDTLRELSLYPPPTPEHYAFARRCTYFTYRAIMNCAESEGPELLLQSPFAYPGAHSVNPLQAQLKPNRTIKMRLQLDQAILDALQHGWLSAYKAEQMQLETLKTLESKQRHWSFLADGNYVGKLVHARTGQGVAAVLPRIMNAQAQYDAVRLQLALRLFELSHQGLPDTLDALKHTYLSDVPLDPYTNLPLRWNPETKVVYSIGANLVDDNGNITQKHRQDSAPLDVGMRYWWSSPDQ